MENSLLVLFHPILKSFLKLINLLLGNSPLKTGVEEGNKFDKVLEVLWTLEAILEDNRANEENPERPHVGTDIGEAVSNVWKMWAK